MFGLPKLYLYIATFAVLSIGGGWWGHSHNVKEQEIGAKSCLADVQVQAAIDHAQGEKAVAEARAAASEREAKEASNRAAANQREAEQLKQDAASAHAKASALELRYQLQLKQDKSCAAWAAQVVPCELQ